MKPFLVILPFHRGDFPLTLTLMDWLRDLGGVSDYPILLLPAKRVLNVELQRVVNAASPLFASVTVERAPGIENERWPRGANLMFRRAAELAQTKFHTPFLWLEPDAVLLKPNALDLIWKEYTNAGKPFMGNVRHQTTNANLPRTYLPGCSVYPVNALSRLHSAMTNIDIAWDVSTAALTVPNAHSSKLFYEWWGVKGVPPVFRAERGPGDPVNVMTPAQIPDGTVFFHRSKDGSLIDVLRGTLVEKLFPTPPVPTNVAQSFARSYYESASAPLPVASPRILHVVERHRPEPPRIQVAVRSWQALYNDPEANVYPLHVHASPRNARQLGDTRDLPYLKDLLTAALSAQPAADIILFTNGDIVLHPDLPGVLRAHLDRYGAVSSFRINYASTPALYGTVEWWASKGQPDFGRDLFAFRRQWLIDHWASIPNFFVGEWEWDLVLALMVRMANRVPITTKSDLKTHYAASEIPLGYVVHELHERKWLSKAMFNSPAKRHNLKLANNWYRQHGLDDYQIIL